MVGFDGKKADKEKAALHVDLHSDRLFFFLLVMSERVARKKTASHFQKTRGDDLFF
jgi:hypothetical protein